RDHAADGRLRGSVDRPLLSGPRERLREIADPHPGLDHGDHLRRLVGDEAVELRRGELRLDLRRLASVEVRPASNRQKPAAVRRRIGDLRDDLRLRDRLDQIHDPSGSDSTTRWTSEPRAAAWSPHFAPSGRTFWGFIRVSGSKELRTHACAARSSSEKTSGMKSRFSSPIPCSPERTPPASTQRRTISSEAERTFSSVPGTERSNASSGWRFPSPAWKTF